MKSYIKPQVKFLDSDTEELLAGSGVVGGDGGIGYGGIDDGGTKEPSANIGVWDESGEETVHSVWDE